MHAYLLLQILKNEDQSTKQAVLNVCQMMVDCLVENVLSLDENSGMYVHTCVRMYTALI